MSEATWWANVTVIRRQEVPTPQSSIPVDFWNPTKETEAAFRARIKGIKAELDKWAKAHVREVKSHFVKYDTKRNSEHYHWAALRLAGQKTYREIAEYWANSVGGNIDLDEATVRKGVQAVLKILELSDMRPHRKLARKKSGESVSG